MNWFYYSLKPVIDAVFIKNGNTIKGHIEYNIRLIFERLYYEYIKCRTFNTWLW